MNTPDYVVKDLLGLAHTQIGTKKDFLGKPIPGATVTVLAQDNKPNTSFEEGRIFVKHAFAECVEWIETGYFGFIDECGFVQITK